jgi:hypothetical protein
MTTTRTTSRNRKPYPKRKKYLSITTFLGLPITTSIPCPVSDYLFELIRLGALYIPPAHLEKQMSLSVQQTLVFVSVGFMMAVLYTDIMFEMQVYTKDIEDTEAHEMMLAYYTRIFTAPLGPVGLLSMFVIATGGTIRNIYTRGVSALRVFALVVILIPQVAAALYLFPICQEMTSSSASREFQRESLKILFWFHSSFVFFVVSFFVANVMDSCGLDRHEGQGKTQNHMN